MPPAYEILLLNTSIPQIQAAQAGDTYVVPRDIAFSTVASFAAGTAAAPSIVATGDVNTGIWFPAADTIAASTGGTEQMRLTSTGLGIGTSSPTQKLTVSTSASDVASFVSGDTNADIYFKASGTTLGNTRLRATGGDLVFITGLNDRMRLDSSGNLGLGVTPSAWISSWKALEQDGVSLASSSTIGIVGQNWWINSSGTDIYRTTAAASIYKQTAGAHSWGIAPSGTAGNAITFVQAMTLDASGNLGIGTTSPSDKLDVRGGRSYLESTSGDQYILKLTNPANADGVFLGSPATDSLAVYSASGTEHARITSVGNFSIGGTADRATTVGTKTLNIFDGTAPVGTLANGVSFYSASGEANVMDAAGNATLLSPHDTETNEWIFRSKHTPTGKVLRIDVERLLRFVNAHFGLDAVKEFVEE
jgi:hypothetical protein